MKRFHKGLTSKKWQKFPRFQQLLMIGTEFGRAKDLLRDNYYKDVMDCYDRAYELIDLTIEDSNGLFQKELLRLREYFGNLYLRPNIRLNNQLYRFLLTLDQKAYNCIDLDKL